MESKVWFITGASRGMGYEFARCALERGHRVVATARRPEGLRARFGDNERLCAIALDVTDTDSIDRAVAHACDAFGTIDVLINNAGFGIFGALEETSDAETRAIFDTNFFGPLNLIRAVLPIMRQARSGRIINIASMAGFAPDPGGVLYDSSKAALISASEALGLELAEFGIQTMAVCPGMFRTNFFDGSSLKTPDRLLEAYESSAARAALTYCLDHNYQQYGDPRKVAALVCTIALEPHMPAVLPVGRDAIKKYKRRAAESLEAIEAYEQRAGNTSFPREDTGISRATE